MKTKLHTRIFRAMLVAVMMAAAFPAGAYIKYLNGIYYDRIGTTNKFYVTYKDSTYNSYHGTVNIPDVLITNHNYKVVAIGERAFKDCPNLVNVTIGANVDTIHEYAFHNCTSLPSINIPSTVEIISDNAFEGCTSLSNISLPVNTILGKNLFKGCSGITSFSFLSGRKAIEIGMFRDCSGLTNLQLPQSIDSICDYAFMGCHGLSKLTITNKIKSIGKFAFKDCTNIDTLIIDVAVSGISINSLAFSGCDTLTTIVSNAIVPPVLDKGLGLSEQQLENVKLIVPHSSLEAYQNADGWKEIANIEARAYDFEKNGFYYKVINNNDVAITYKDTDYNSYGHISDLPSNVSFNGNQYNITTIGENAFRNCSQIKSIFLRNIKIIEKNAFMGCYNLEEVDYSSVQKRIGSHAFEGCTKLQRAIFEEGLEYIDSCAFYGCSNLKSITLPATLKRIGAKAFLGAPLNGFNAYYIGVSGIYCNAWTPPVIEDSNAFGQSQYSNVVVKVPYSRLNAYEQADNWRDFAKLQRNTYDFNKNGVFYRISGNNKVNIATGIENGGNKRDAILPEQVVFNGSTYTVRGVDDGAFYSVYDINIRIPNTVKQIGNYAFAKTMEAQIVLGDSVESIGRGAFNQSYLHVINIPKSVTFIGDSAFLATPELNHIIVEEGNPVYDSRDNSNSLIRTADNTLIAGSNNSFIPEGVTAIEDWAFYAKYKLGDMIIPNSVNRIGHLAFAGCSSMKNVVLPSSLPLPVYGEGVFFGSGLIKLEIPEGTKTIGGLGVFSSTKLQELSIPNTVETIQNSAFKDCHNLKNITIPNSVKVIEDYAFYQSQSLEELTIGSNVETIGEQAFHCAYVVGNYHPNIRCLAENPPILTNENCFQSIYSRGTLYVPQESVELYKNAYGWKNFFTILPIDESGINEVPVDPAAEDKRQRYNLMGQPVGDDYKGIVIENGKKILVK